jgi:hypothetical protein
MFMARINYKQLLEKTRSSKFKLLSDDKEDPFFEICKDERIWMIMFIKTRDSIKEHFPDLFNEDVFKRLFETAYWKDPITNEKKWKDPRSVVNDTLNEFREHLERYNINWKRLQDYEKPVMRECNYDDINGHSLCKNQKNCKMKVGSVMYAHFPNKEFEGICKECNGDSHGS